MLKWLAKSLVILILFVPFALGFPLAALTLSRTPDGAMFVFWAAPWSCAFWTLIYSTLSGVPWRDGGAAVRRKREADGGLLVASMRATAWMCFGLAGSYVAEGLLIWTTRSLSAWLVLASYSPLFVCWCWRRLHA